MRFASAVGLLCLLTACSDEPSGLGDGERIVFFGDSITQAGHYVTDVEAYFLTRFPDRELVVVNHGISSETISGTSEADHFPRRPDAHRRFRRDVAAWRPDVVVACFGMNDGNYHPPDAERFARYRDGINRLVERTQGEAGARLVLLSPPPFDPYRRQVGDPNAKTFGYKYPAINYDDTLASYARWLLNLRGKGLTVVDLHATMNDLLRRRREGDVSYAFSGDGVHPDQTGHWLMAQALLLDLKAPAEVAEARIDASGMRAVAGEVDELERTGAGLRFRWRTPLPAPIPPECDGRMLKLAETSERLNRYRLAVSGLPAGRYEIRASLEGTPATVGEASAEALARGIDLTRLPRFPTVARSQEVLARLRARNQQEYERWRQAIASGGPGPQEPTEAYRAATEAIRALCRPCRVRVAIVKVD